MFRVRAGAVRVRVRAGAVLRMIPCKTRSLVRHISCGTIKTPPLSKVVDLNFSAFCNGDAAI